MDDKKLMIVGERILILRKCGPKSYDWTGWTRVYHVNTTSPASLKRIKRLTENRVGVIETAYVTIDYKPVSLAVAFYF